MKEHFEQIPFDNRFPVQIQNTSLNHFELHWHSYIEIFFTLEGSIVITTDSLSFYLDKGDICFLNSGVIHSINQAGVNNRVMSLKISTSEKGPFYKLNRFRFDDGKYLNDLKNNQVPLSSLQQILFYIYYEYEKKLPGYKNLILSLINALFGIMIRFRYLVPKTDAEGAIDNSLERLNGILQYLDEHYSEKISLQDMAEQLHMNYYYLSHFFKNTAGVTFQEYINRLRLDKSLSLLADRDKTITSIALETGFPNTKAYTNAFKTKYGMLPSKYRAAYIEHSPDSGSGISPEIVSDEQLGQAFLSDSGDIKRFLSLYPTFSDQDFKNVITNKQRKEFEIKDFCSSGTEFHAPLPILNIDADALTFFPTDSLIALFQTIPFGGYAVSQDFVDSAFLTAAKQKIESSGIREITPAPPCEMLLVPEWQLLNYSALQSCHIVREFLTKQDIPKAIPLSLTQIAQCDTPLDVGSLLCTLQGIPSPAYFTFSLLYRLSGQIIRQSPEYLLLQNGNRLFLLFCSSSLSAFLAYKKKKDFTISSYFSFLKGTPAEFLIFHLPQNGRYSCKLTVITSGHGCIADSWYCCGATKKLNNDDITYFHNTVRPSYIKYEELPNQTLAFELPPLGCGLAEIQIL